LATFLMPISGQGHLTVPPGAAEVAGRLRSASRRMMVTAFGDPYGPASLPGSGTYLLAWQPRGDAAQRAAARAIAGRSPVRGTLPITLPGARPGALNGRPALDGRLEFAAPEAVGLDRFIIDRVDSIVQSAIVRGASPGAAVAIGRYGRLVMLRGYGDLDLRRGFAAVTDSSIYDLASVDRNSVG